MTDDHAESDAAERRILGAILRDGRGALRRALDAGLSPGRFRLGQHEALMSRFVADDDAELPYNLAGIVSRGVTLPGVHEPLALIRELYDHAGLTILIPRDAVLVMDAARARDAAAVVQIGMDDPAAAMAALADVEADNGWAQPSCAPADGVAFARGDEVELGEHLAARLGGHALCCYDEGSMWRYRAGAWHEVAEDDLVGWAHSFSGQPARAATGKVGAVRLSARAARGVASIACVAVRRPGWFAEAPPVAAFRDSAVRLDGDRVVVEPLGRHHRVRASAVAGYQVARTASAPAFLSLLRDAWDGLDDIDTRIAYLLEWAGAALLGITTRWKASPLLFGPKDSGKSRIIDAIVGLFPPASRRAVSLHSLAREYDRAALVGARINAVSELPARELLDGEAAKAILSGDAVSARQPHGRVFQMVSRCAHIFAANELPPSLDRALMSRFVPLSCPTPRPEHLQDPGLGDRLRAEAPGLARLALDHVPALLARGRFAPPRSARSGIDEWAMSSDSVASWVNDRVTRTVDASGSGSALYRSYVQWCGENGHRAVASNRWGVRMLALGFHRHRSNGAWWTAEVDVPASDGRSAWGDA